MATAKTTGTTLEELLNTQSGQTSDAKTLIEDFASSNKLGIVSPTLMGLLDSFKSGGDSITISIGGYGFCGGNFSKESDNAEAEVNQLLSITKDKEAAQSADFSDAAGAFVSKVSQIKASFILKSTTTDTSNTASFESCENAFMRMLGMPDEAEIGGTEKSLLYINPDSGKMAIAKLADIMGTKQYADIFNQRKLNSSSRIYNFNTLKPPSCSDSTAPIITDNSSQIKQTAVDYFHPDDQLKFYYLKSVPVQDSTIYSCIFETDKIVMKPFDVRSATKINGNKVHTSLLESIIRLRLDRVTGNPGIYPLDSDGLSTFSLKKPDNVGADSVTQVECFLIDKLRKILFQLADAHILKAKTRSEEAAKAAAEAGQCSDQLVDETVTAGSPIPTPRAPSDYVDEIQHLEMLKAREDAILFLLKDTSKSYDGTNIDSTYSALQLQEGIIRTSSGFDDILSGPLYSILKQKSDYLDSKITQVKAAAEAKNTPPPTGGDPSGIVYSSSGDSYVGVSSEDFVIYCIALLMLDENYLIGLLTQERRVNLANTISNSILSSDKDPYGLLDKVSRSAANGGFPDVVDSVNALAVLVANFYQAFVAYCKVGNVSDVVAGHESAAQAVGDKSSS